MFGSLFPFFAPIRVFLLLFLLLKLVLLKDFPKLSELGFVLERSFGDFLQVAPTRHCSFVMGP